MAGRLQTLAAAAFGVLVATAATSARAALLAPGGAIAPVTELEPGSGATLLDSVSESFSTFTGTGTLHSQVYTADATNPFGADKLTFTYRIENNDADGVPSDIFQLAVSSFAGYLTDVGYNADGIAGAVAPSFAQRGAGPEGEQIAFSFINAPVGAGSITPGRSSALLIIQTDATTFAPTLSSMGGALAPNLGTFAPIAVPEPASLGLLALVGMALNRRRRGAR